MALLTAKPQLGRLSLGFGSSPFQCRPHRCPSVSSHAKCLPNLQISALLNPQDDPIVKEALKEPLAFLGGVFAGVLRLDMNEDPLREWVTRTSSAAGVQGAEEAETIEETPEEIQIE